MAFRRARAGAATVAATILAALLLAASSARAQIIAEPATDARALSLAAAMAAADAKDWAAADAAAARANDPLVPALTQWRRLSEVGGDWAEMAEFLRFRPDWPRSWRIRAKAEAAMPESVAAAAALDFFGDAEPLSARGGRLKAEALASDGRVAEAEALIRKVWAAYGMGDAERRIFLDRHLGLIAPLHDERIDALAWRGLYTDAEALYPLVGEPLRRLSAARAALRRREAGVNGAIDAVPASLRDDPGLAYERFDWRMAKGRRADAEAMILARSTSAETLGRPELWAGGRRLLAREALRDGRFEAAYRLAATHRLTGGDAFADLEWLAGWIALTRLGDPAAAGRHFQTLWDGVSSPISLARAGYWRGRALAAAGDRAGAAGWFDRAAAFPETFYGQLAAEAIGAPTPDGLGRGDAAGDDPAIVGSERFRAGLALLDAGRPDLGVAFVEAAAADLAGKTALAHAALDRNAPFYALRIAKAARRDGVIAPQALYPLIDLPAVAAAPERALALAIVRQESEFNPRALSPAGARGLMQLMPKTAERTAPGAGLGYDPDRLLADWRYNAALGQTYLAAMLERFAGSYVLAVAAYNAGPAAVDRWIERLGDPRRSGADVIDWIESIPYGETRNYVQRVLESTAIYRHLLTGAPIAGGLVRDLGGAG